MIKRILAILCTLAFAVTAAGCTASVDSSDDFSIVCTIFPAYDFARSITAGCDGITVRQLLKSGMEAHDFDPTADDVAAINNADVFICNGGESDAWTERVLNSVSDELTVIKMTDAVTLTAEDDSSIAQNEHEHGDEHDDEYDEHVWTSVANAIKITQAISDALCEKNSENTEKLRSNTQDYINRLKELDDDFRTLTENGKRKTIVVADRFPLKYFCDEYGLSYYAAFSGCAASVEPSAKTLISLSEAVKSNNIPIVFKTELSTGVTAEYVASETGARVLEFHSCHNRTAAEAEQDETYISLMRKNLSALKEALY